MTEGEQLEVCLVLIVGAECEHHPPSAADVGQVGFRTAGQVDALAILGLAGAKDRGGCAVAP